MYSNLLQLATLVSVAAALPQGWEDWKPSTSRAGSTASTSSSIWSWTTPVSKSKTISTSISSSTPNSSGHRWEAWNLPNTTTATSTMSTSARVPWGSGNGGAAGYGSAGSSGQGGSSHGSSSSGMDGSVGSSYNDWSGEPALYSASAPTATLSPTTHWSHKPADPVHLVPSDNNRVYYAPAGTGCEFIDLSFVKN